MTLMQASSCRRLQAILMVGDMSPNLGELPRLKIPLVVIHTASGFHEASARALILGLSKRKKDTQKDTHFIHVCHFVIYIVKRGAI